MRDRVGCDQFYGSWHSDHGWYGQLAGEYGRVRNDIVSLGDQASECSACCGRPPFGGTAGDQLSGWAEFAVGLTLGSPGGGPTSVGGDDLASDPIGFVADQPCHKSGGVGGGTPAAAGVARGDGGPRAARRRPAPAAASRGC